MDNPFEPITTQRLATIYEWPAMALRFLDGEADCLHVMGAEGMGKTTLLIQIQHRLAQEGVTAAMTVIGLGAGVDASSVAPGPVTLLDETDRLSPQQLDQLLVRVRNTGARLVLATHRSQVRQVRRAGLTCLPLRLRPLARTEDVGRVFEGRLRIVFPEGDPRRALSPEAARALLRFSRGNVERCLQIGYEVFEDLDTVRPISPADIRAAAAALSRALL